MKSVLIIWGDWDGHRPRECADLFAAQLAARGFSVELADTLSVLEDTTKLATLSLIVPMWTMGQLTPDQETNLVAAITDGAGLAGFHGGMGDAFRGSIRYQWLVGGQFVAHPDDFKEYTVTFTNRDDAITAGLADFRLRSEQYYLLVDPHNEVLATTTMAPSVTAPWTTGVVMPCVWKKTHGAGRVFYCALGHAPEDFIALPALLELTLRGMSWAAR